MTEPIDIYADQLQTNVGPYGCTLNFMVSPAMPPAPGSSPQPERLATVRTSLEHLKVITFIFRRQVLEYERQRGVSIQVPVEVLNSLSIGGEDWETFWRQ